MKTTRVKYLHTILPKMSGRDSTGKVSVRHQGGRHKRYYRLVDWKRDKVSVPGQVIAIEFDPNRSAPIALIQYADGDKRYILAPLGLSVGHKIVASDTADIQPGNALHLRVVPIGTMVHNIELFPGRGAQLLRSAGSGAMIIANDGSSVQIKLPSGEIRAFSGNNMATVGQVGNIDWKNRVIGKAGRNRHMGIRPTVRGVAQNPRSHPHGGGEGRSGIGLKAPKTPWGKKALGKRTRKRKKYSDKYIIQRRSTIR